MNLETTIRNYINNSPGDVAIVRGQFMEKFLRSCEVDGDYSEVDEAERMFNEIILEEEIYGIAAEV